MLDLNRATLKSKAKETLKASYWNAFLVAFIISMVTGGISTIVSLPSSMSTIFTSGSYNSFYDIGYDFGMGHDFGMGSSLAVAGIILIAVLVAVVIGIVFALAFQAFVVGPLTVGANKFFINSTYKKDEVGTISFAFSNGYMNVVKGSFLAVLYPTLWALVPFAGVFISIYKSYSYAMVPYLLADNPAMPPKRALELSTQIMHGRRMNYFVLSLSFMGWALLSLFTFGIGAFFLSPYIYATNAQFYMAVSTDAINRGITNRAELNLPEPVAPAMQ